RVRGYGRSPPGPKTAARHYLSHASRSLTPLLGHGSTGAPSLAAADRERYCSPRKGPRRKWTNGATTMTRVLNYDDWNTALVEFFTSGAPEGSTIYLD